MQNSIFDKVEASVMPVFTTMKQTFENRSLMHPNAKARLALLQTLYRAREAEPRTGWLTERDLKDAHGDIEFAMGVLVETGQAVADGFRYRITGAGVLAFEAHGGSRA